MCRKATTVQGHKRAEVCCLVFHPPSRREHKLQRNSISGRVLLAGLADHTPHPTPLCYCADGSYTAINRSASLW